jgi:serine protease
LIPDWGLDRIDQESTDGDGSYTSAYDGTGVDIYIVDTGIQLDHDEFNGRATCGFTIGDNDDCADGNGHGTHVAGIAAGRKYGVAKNANIIAVKVLGDDGSGSLAGIIAGIDYVIEKKASTNCPSVINMSLGGSRSIESNNAVTAAVTAGIVTVVAAGNSNKDACTASPASALSVITVGSTTQSDTRSSFSNVGPCVDIFAPGSSILSSIASTSSTTESAILSGTSMASPFVAGVAALHLQNNPSFAPAQVLSAITADAVANMIKFKGIDYLLKSRRSVNRLLNTKSLK